MNNMGQCCVAGKRFIVVESVADKFLEKFQTALAAFKPGDPMDWATNLGPLSTEAALLQLLGQIKNAVKKGAKLVMGGKRVDRPGSYMEPTILTNIKPSNPAYHEEFFGPVALFFRVNDEDEAVALANDSEFGLGVRCSRRMSRAANAWPVALTPAWSSSITQHGLLRNCRSAASKIPVTAANFPVWASRSL
jgi:succinate-semialdehyde dehydrogenase/glutarate-semialdehyde dehydrogenase